MNHVKFSLVLLDDTGGGCCVWACPPVREWLVKALDSSAFVPGAVLPPRPGGHPSRGGELEAPRRLVSDAALPPASMQAWIPPAAGRNDEAAGNKVISKQSTSGHDVFARDRPDPNRVKETLIKSEFPATQGCVAPDLIIWQ